MLRLPYETFEELKDPDTAPISLSISLLLSIELELERSSSKLSFPQLGFHQSSKLEASSKTKQNETKQNITKAVLELPEFPKKSIKSEERGWRTENREL